MELDRLQNRKTDAPTMTTAKADMMTMPTMRDGDMGSAGASVSEFDMVIGDLVRVVSKRCVRAGHASQIGRLVTWDRWEFMVRQ